jgi:hypothetical protein
LLSIFSVFSWTTNTLSLWIFLGGLFWPPWELCHCFFFWWPWLVVLVIAVLCLLLLWW